MELNQTYLGDCLELMPLIPDKSIDMVLCDLPYAVTARKFIHSSRYKSYFEKNGTYYRPPNHLNPMRIDIAKKVDFKNKSHGEDTDWAMELCKLKPYNKELFIQKPIYFYRYQLKPIYK